MVGDETQDGGVVRKRKDGVGAVCGYTVIREQGKQKGPEYAALRGSGAQGQSRGGEAEPSSPPGVCPSAMASSVDLLGRCASRSGSKVSDSVEQMWF